MMSVRTATTASEFDAPFDRIYRGRNQRRLQGKRCRVLARGASKLAVLVEFENGERVVTASQSLRWDNDT
jgi:hypothetical protein